MNQYIKEQLLKAKNVSFYNEENKMINKDELDKYDSLIIKEQTFNDEETVVFTFEDYLIKPFGTFDFHERFNKGVNIPLLTMQGKIEREVGKMYYIKVKGFYFKSYKCVHCLKDGEYSPVCNECFKKLNVNDIEDISWEGYVPQKSIRCMENI